MQSTDDTRQTPKAGRVQATVTLQVDAYGVMSQAVASGVEAGFRRANKHTTTLPDADTEQGRSGIDTVTEAVLAEITQWFAFPPFGLDATDGPLNSAMAKPADTTAAAFSVGFALATKLRALAGNERECDAIARLEGGVGLEADMRVAAAVLVQAGEWDAASLLMRMVVWDDADGQERPE